MRVVISVDMLRRDWCRKYFGWFEGMEYTNHTTFSAWTIDVFAKMAKMTDREGVAFITDGRWLARQMLGEGFKDVRHSSTKNLAYMTLDKPSIIHFWGTMHNIFGARDTWEEAEDLVDYRLSKLSEMVRDMVERNPDIEFALTADHGVVKRISDTRHMHEDCLHVPLILRGKSGETARYTSHKGLADWVSGGDMLGKEDWREVKSTALGNLYRWGNDWKVENLGPAEKTGVWIR